MDTATGERTAAERADLEEIKGLTKRFQQGEPVGMESYEALERISAARDPEALPLLRSALAAGADYAIKWHQVAESTSADVKKHSPGGWMIDSTAEIATEYVRRLHSAIDACTPEGEAAVYAEQPRKHWWNRR